MKQTALKISMFMLLFICMVLVVSATGNYIFTYQSNANSFNMSAGCSGIIGLNANATMPLEVCLQDSSNNTISGTCVNYTSGVYTHSINISTNNISFSNLVNGQSYRMSIHWKKIQYVNMSNSSLNGFNDSGLNASNTAYFDCMVAGSGSITTGCGTNIHSTFYVVSVDDGASNPGCFWNGGIGNSWNIGGTYEELYYGSSSCSSLVNGVGTTTYLKSTNSSSSRRVYDSYVRSGGTNATGSCDIVNRRKVSASSCGCFGIGGIDFYTMSSCSQGIEDSYPSGLCTYAGDNTDYSNSFIYNASVSSVSVTFNNKLLSTGNIYFNLDNATISPQNFNATKNIGDVFNMTVYITDSPNSSLRYNYSLSIQNSSAFSISTPGSVDIINNGSFSMTITPNINATNTTYDGNITVLRNVDNRTWIIPITLGISTQFGIPQVLNISAPLISIYSDETWNQSFEIKNVGTYNLTSCAGSLDSGFTGWTFYSFTTNMSLAVNETKNFSILFSSPPVGSYSGYLQVTCIATITGQSNSLESTNKPILLLSSSARPSTPPSAGGGGGLPYIPPSSGDVNATFRLETDSGGTSSGLYFFPGQSRDISIVLTSLITTDQDITLGCQGDFCSHVVLNKNKIRLSGKSFQIVLLNMKVPADTPYGKSFAFSIVASDASARTRSLDVQIEVSPIADFVNKFALQVQPGDEGYLLSIGSFNVPKLVFYILFIGVFEAILAFTIPNKGASGRNPQAFWMPILGIVATVFIILLV